MLKLSIHAFRRCQRAVFTGYKARHGLKVQGVTFPNGLQVISNAMMVARRNDKTLYRVSGVEEEMGVLSQRVGRTLRLFADSGYDFNRHCMTLPKYVLVIVKANRGGQSASIVFHC